MQDEKTHSVASFLVLGTPAAVVELAESVLFKA